MPVIAHVFSGQLLCYLGRSDPWAPDTQRKRRFGQIRLSILSTECEITSILILADHDAE